MAKYYLINATLEIKAKSLQSAMKKLEPLTRRKMFKVIKLEYNGASKK